MSLIRTLTWGYIYRNGESPRFGLSGGWWKYGNYWIPIILAQLPTYLRLLPIWIMSLFRVKFAQKIMGRALGFSCCAHCGMPWKYVEGKPIPFSDSSGMFPLCEQCFDELSPQRIDMYIDQLINTWLDDHRRLRLEWQMLQPADLAEAAKAEVRRMKASV